LSRPAPGPRDASAQVERGLGEPGRQVHVEHLAGPARGAAEQGRLPGAAGVELPAALAQQVFPPPCAGCLDGTGQDRRDPPEQGPGQALPQCLTVDRVRQAGLHAPSVVVHVHQPLDLGILQAGRISDLFEQRNAERFPRREQFDRRDSLRCQTGQPGRDEFHQPAGRRQRRAQRPDAAGLRHGTRADRADQ